MGSQSSAQENNDIQSENFRLLDGDGNGIITIRELGKYQDGKTDDIVEVIDAELMFYVLDRDNNNVVTYSEHTKGVDWEVVRQYNLAKSRGDSGHGFHYTLSKNNDSDRADSFQAIDFDVNTIVTIRELTKYHEGRANENGETSDAELMFYAIDRDHNKIITASEYLKGVDQESARHITIDRGIQVSGDNSLKYQSPYFESSNGESFQLMDRDGNNLITLSELTEFNVGKTNENGNTIDADLLFESLDRDNNKIVTIREYTKGVSLIASEEKGEIVRSIEETGIDLEQITTEKRKARRLAIAKKEERRIKTAELKAERQESRRLAQTEKERKMERLEEKRQHEDVLMVQQSEAKELAKSKKKEERRRADDLKRQRIETERLAQTKKREELKRSAQEKLEALDVEQRETRRNIEDRKKEKRLKAAEIKAQRRESRRLVQIENEKHKERLAKERREAEVLAAKQREAEKLAETMRREELRRAAELKRQRKDAERLAKAKKQKALKELAKKADKEYEALQQVALQTKEKEQLESESEHSNTAIENVSVSNGTKIKPYAFVIIRGKEEDKKLFENLEDYIEFDFLFANARSKTTIFNQNQSITLPDVQPMVSEEHGIIILIDQKEYVAGGASKYQISIIEQQIDTEWKEASSDSYNLNNRADLKLMSKKITEFIPN